MNRISPTWICCQIGAREHYAIPSILHQHGELAHFVTDAWVVPHSPLKILTKSGLRERFHPTLAQAKVHSFNISAIRLEIAQKLQKYSNWEQIIARNHWFQQQVIKRLRQLAPTFSTPPTLFAYSYAALDIFRFAKQQGWYTVLGQIDPGILEEEIVRREHDRYPHYHPQWQSAPPTYWQTWQEECKIADSILVNSHWSRQLLEQAGIESHKLKITPLIYTPPEIARDFVRTYPESFTQTRPLRVLFLGQVILRKGVAAVLESLKFLEGYPVEFWIVGSPQIKVPSYWQNHPQIHWVGAINRSETPKYYQLADVFLFPTLSDGFGLTQLEAQAWQLPIIASGNCGEVLVDGMNGLLLSIVSGEVITQAIQNCLDRPQMLQEFANRSISLSDFSSSDLYQSLQSLSN